MGTRRGGGARPALRKTRRMVEGRLLWIDWAYATAWWMEVDRLIVKAQRGGRD
jgi:hypothetical protein